ncbi:MAG: GspE/PulE family protein [Planctomycetota bacterium]|jgi:type II secretory ATPase GspE/PulE/Tfp pilus assembly ATPase PilB-like protein
MSEDLEGLAFQEIDFDEAELAQAVAAMIRQAVELPASDLFLTWNEENCSVSVRHLGMSRRLTTINREEGRRVVNYVKAMAGMDLAQKMRPLDGRWVCRLENGKKTDLRINTIPTMYGEDMALRLLERDATLRQLDQLGLHRKDLGLLKSLLSSPGGLILVTGPTGSGKTTSLYACLHYLNDGTRKINTIEDPIEYALDGIHQSSVNPKIDLDFPELLRSVLRQAPDVIMVGEVRDPVTAETAVRAASSGHLVLATLHAPTAAGAVDSILSLGAVPHFLASCLLGVLTQRLVRTLCEHCKTSYDISESLHTFDDVKSWLEPGQGEHLYSAPGCHHCNREGYTGRTGVFEVLKATKEIRRLIAQRRTVREIRDKAVEQGMLNMRHSALLKVADGVTSTEEVIRVIPTEHLMPDE